MLTSDQNSTAKMVRINKNSIFNNVDLDDADSIRRVMVGLDYQLTNKVLRPAVPELRNMRVQERSVARVILSTIRTNQDYPLLLEATLRLIDARNGSSQQVLAAARDLENLATDMVLTIPQAHPVQYAAAQALFNKTRAVGDSVATYQDLQQRVCTVC